jgi:hypothetical protein
MTEEREEAEYALVRLKGTDLYLRVIRETTRYLVTADCYTFGLTGTTKLERDGHIVRWHTDTKLMVSESALHQSRPKVERKVKGRFIPDSPKVLVCEPR